MWLRRHAALISGQFAVYSPLLLRAACWSQTGAAAAPPRTEGFAVKSRADTQTNSSRDPENNSRVMPSNVEIKAKVSDPKKFGEKAAELSQSEGTIIRQHDTFFNCSQGRLKLRDFMNESGQLIYYERPDTDGPKLSRYSISPTSDPSSLRTVLSDALGVKGEVRKERRLFLIGQTRVHMDTVEGLGHYMELEIMLEKMTTVRLRTRESSQEKRGEERTDDVSRSPAELKTAAAS